MPKSSDPTHKETEAEFGSRGMRWGRVALGVSLTLALVLTLLFALFDRTSLRGSLGSPGKRKAPVPGFDLTDQDGRPFNSRSLDGKVWVANFIFTRCTAACPVMAGKLLLVQDAVKAVPGLAEKVRLLSFSVDPKRDQPGDLDSFSKSHGADPKLWRFLTGEEGAVVKLSQDGFSLGASEGAAATTSNSAPEPVHSDRFVLVDSEGYIRDYYRPISEKRDLERLIADIKRLTVTAR